MKQPSAYTAKPSGLKPFRRLAVHHDGRPSTSSEGENAGQDFPGSDGVRRAHRGVYARDRQGAGQQPPVPPRALHRIPTARRTRSGQGRGRGVFPAMQRPPGDPATIERGKQLFGVNCSACHGVDARGGQLGGPNLLRSQLVLMDQDGEMIAPVVQNGQPDKGMPRCRCRRQREGDRGVHPQPDRREPGPGRAAAIRGAAGEHPRRRCRGGADVLRREMQLLPLGDGRSAGDRDACGGSEDAAEPVGRRWRWRRTRPWPRRRRTNRPGCHGDDRIAVR